MVGYETICKDYSAERRVGEYGPWADGRRWDGGSRDTEVHLPGWRQLS